MTTKLPKYLTDQEAEDLRAAVITFGDLRDLAIFDFLLTYGPRASEVGMLKLSDINWDNETIVVPRLKNGETSVWPLMDPFKSTLNEWLQEKDSPTNWVFPGAKFKGISRKTLWEKMQKYGEYADIPKEKRHPHSCRHYVAVHALDKGLEMHDVKDLLGHRSITSTQIYAKVSSKRRRKVAEMLEK